VPLKCRRVVQQLKYRSKSTSADGLLVNLTFKGRDNIANEAAEK
jgi:hypothetical protein